MIKKNMLSLKELKAELEALKNQSHSERKPNVVHRFYKGASLPFLFLFASILTYAHKLPIISKIIKILSLW